MEGPSNEMRVMRWSFFLKLRNYGSDHYYLKKWLKSNEVRELLGISPGTLQNLRINGTLPYTKIGGVLYYDQREIMEVLERNKVNKNF